MVEIDRKLGKELDAKEKKKGEEEEGVKWLMQPMMLI